MHNNITFTRQINNSIMKRTTQCKYWPKKRKKKEKKKKQILPAFETDVNNKRYIMTVTCYFCLVYLSDSLQP